MFKLSILLINKKCVGGFFGQNCTQTCGTKCKGCNTVTGVCENGCHPGWEGHFCQTGWLGCFSSSCKATTVDSLYTCIFSIFYDFFFYKGKFPFPVPVQTSLTIVCKQNIFSFS